MLPITMITANSKSESGLLFVKITSMISMNKSCSRTTRSTIILLMARWQIQVIFRKYTYLEIFVNI